LDFSIWQPMATSVSKARSLSPQEASYANPRAVLFSSTADFVVTFNGGFDQAHGNTLEVLQYRTIDNKRHAELFEIEFDKNKKSAPILSHANPLRCIVCHESDPKPLWGDYESTPGVFGAAGEGLGLDPNDKQTQLFFDFKRAALTHPRYSQLHWPKFHRSWPYAVKDESLNIETQPNIWLTTMLSAQHILHVNDLVAEMPLFQIMPATFIRTQYCGFDKDSAAVLDTWMLKAFGQGAPQSMSRSIAVSLYGLGKEDHADQEFEYMRIKDDEVLFKPMAIRYLFGMQADSIELSPRDKDKRYAPSSAEGLDLYRSGSTQTGLFLETEGMWAQTRLRNTR
jgi:hypothetical protein